MWVSSLEVRGLADCDGRRSLERIDTAPRPLQDALSLFVMGAHPLDAIEGAERLGWDPILDEDLHLDAPEAVQAIRAEQAERSFQITATLQPDPPLFGRLRNAVLRDPERAAGLVDGTLSARIGWLFTPDLEVAQPDLIGARLGQVDIPLAEASWVAPLLADVAKRFRFEDWRTPIIHSIDALATALWSPDPGQRMRGEQALAALEGLGLDLRPVRYRETLTLGVGPALRPFRWAGPAAERTLRTVVAAQVHAPDVLVIPWAPPAAEQAWLESACTGDDAVLEQLITVAP